MTKIVLEGGTDVAEMVLFSVDNIPAGKADEKIVDKMENENHLIRFPTGADGAYLLHLYVNEEIEEDTLKYCNLEDVIKGKLKLNSGSIAFGGLESVHEHFKPNKNIRSDGKVEEGLFEFSAFHTDYPDELIENHIKNGIGKINLKYLNYPVTIAWVGVVITFIFVIFAINSDVKFWFAALLVVFCTKVWYSGITKSQKYKQLKKKKREIECQFPSIVVKLSSVNAYK